MKFLALAVCTAGLLASSPARADELFGGLYVHDVDTFLSIAGIEPGLDVQVGWRGDRIGRTPLQPYVFGSVNTKGETSFAAAGISAKFGDRIFIRPGLGIAIHNGSDADFFRTDRIAFGSRILLEPELGVGARLSRRATVEASWVHLSHAQIFGRENPGIDNFGVRLSLDL